MGEQDRALHEIADARARLSELADELARKAEPDRLKALATEKAEVWKEKARDLATHKAEELKEHAKDAAAEKVAELKTRAKEQVMQRTTELRERADTPRGWSLLGSLIGAGLGAALMRKAFSAREERWREERWRDDRWRGDRRWPEDDRWRDEGMRAGSAGLRYRGEGFRGDARYDTAPREDIGYRENVDTGYRDVGYGAGTSYPDVSSYAEDGTRRGEGVEGGVRERASEAAHTVKDKAAELKDRALGAKESLKDRASEAVHQVKDRTSHLRERLPARDEVRHRTSDWFSRTLEEQPLLLALGGIAVGMVASTLLPVSNRERQLIEPAKRRAGEGIQHLGEQLEQKLQGGDGHASADDARGFQSDLSASADLRTPATTGLSPSATDLDAAGTQGPDTLASAPTGTSRIPPLPPLDDLTKVH